MPRLRVLAGPSASSLYDMTPCVNSSTSHHISSDLFEGDIVVNVKGFTDPKGQVKDSEYFEREDRRGITWSLQVQGRFLQPYSSDDILFGNTFDKPLKLPWGSGAALKFMSYIDPTLEHDLASSTKPWALSPLISTMPHFVHNRVNSSRSSSPSSLHNADGLLHPPDPHTKSRSRSRSPARPMASFPPKDSITDDTSELYLAMRDDGSLSDSGSNSASPSSSTTSLHSTSSKFTSNASTLSLKLASAGKLKPRSGFGRRKALISELQTASQRRSYFSDSKHRKNVEFGPDDVITVDFCYGFLEFSPSLSLRLPGGVSFDLMKYWDGQPVRFVCCERRQAEGAGDPEEPWGRTFWCVTIELAEDEDDSNEASGDGVPVNEDLD